MGPALDDNSPVLVHLHHAAQHGYWEWSWLTSARFILQQYYSVTWTQFNVRNQIPTSVCALHISGHKRILHRWRFINYLAALQSITAKRRWRSDEETVVHSTAVHEKLTAIKKSTNIYTSTRHPTNTISRPYKISPRDDDDGVVRRQLYTLRLSTRN